MEMESIKLVDDMKELITELIDELDDYSSNKKKIAAKRARKKTLELTGLFKTFRKQSVADCKTF
jgi:hypothetical protein